MAAPVGGQRRLRRAGPVARRPISLVAWRGFWIRRHLVGWIVEPGGDRSWDCRIQPPHAQQDTRYLAGRRGTPGWSNLRSVRDMDSAAHAGWRRGVAMPEPSLPFARHTARSLASAASLMRFLMQPRDLAHPDACDFLAGNPQDLATPAYIEAGQRAVVPDQPSYYSYGLPWQPAVRAVTAALAERLGLELEPEDVFLTRGASSGLATVLRVLIDPGDEVVMMSPPWFFYEAMVLADAAEPVKVPLAGDAF